MTGSRGEVLAERERVKAQLETSDLPGSVPPTVGDFARSWLERISVRCRPTTLRTMAYEIERLLDHVGEYRIDRVTRGDLETMIAKLVDGGLAARTVNGVIKTSKRVIGEWFEEEGLPSPVRRVRALSVPESGNCMTRQEVALALIAAQDAHPRLYPMLLLLLATGMRIGEALGLQWDDLDPDANAISIVRRVCPRGVVDAPKSGRRRRAAMPPALWRALQAWRRHLVETQHPGVGSGWVFPGHRSQGSLSHAAADLQWQGLRQKIGLEHITLHGWRRTHVTLSLEAGIDGVVVQDQVGHTTAEMRRHYTTVRDEVRSSASSRVLALVDRDEDG